MTTKIQTAYFSTVSLNSVVMFKILARYCLLILIVCDKQLNHISLEILSLVFITVGKNNLRLLRQKKKNYSLKKKESISSSTYNETMKSRGGSQLFETAETGGVVKNGLLRGEGSCKCVCDHVEVHP